jgi:hypothetical protein
MLLQANFLSFFLFVIYLKRLRWNRTIGTYEGTLLHVKKNENFLPAVSSLKVVSARWIQSPDRFAQVPSSQRT